MTVRSLGAPLGLTVPFRDFYYDVGHQPRMRLWRALRCLPTFRGLHLWFDRRPLGQYMRCLRVYRVIDALDPKIYRQQCPGTELYNALLAALYRPTSPRRWT